MHPRWLLPLLEVALLVVLTAINPVRLSRRTRIGRYLPMALAGLITLDNVVSAFVLDYGILTDGAVAVTSTRLSHVRGSQRRLS